MEDDRPSWGIRHDLIYQPERMKGHSADLMVVVLAVLLSSTVTAAPMPTPENWKELSEEKKYAYLSRSYGVKGPDGPSGAPEDDVPQERKDWGANAAPVQSHNFGPTLHAKEITAVDWKEWSEQKKFAYLTRNYGVVQQNVR